MVTAEVKTTFETSLLEKFRQKGVLADAKSSQKSWDFSCVPEKVLRLSLPNNEVSRNAPTNWGHVINFEENLNRRSFIS